MQYSREIIDLLRESRRQRYETFYLSWVINGKRNIPIAAYLKRLRRRRFPTQEDVAIQMIRRSPTKRHLGTVKGYVSAIERGRRPTPALMPWINRYLRLVAPEERDSVLESIENYDYY